MNNSNYYNKYNKKKNSKNVIIIGAGPAGIGAARTLINSNIHPIILEGRERIGGRIFQQIFKPNLLHSQKLQQQKQKEEEENNKHNINNNNNNNDNNNTSFTLNSFSSELDKPDIIPDPNLNSTPEVIIQLGANWVHGLDETINPYFAVAKKLQLELHQTSPDDYPGDDVCLLDSGIELFDNDNNFNTNTTFHTHTIVDLSNNNSIPNINTTNMNDSNRSENSLNNSSNISTNHPNRYSEISHEEYQQMLNRYKWIADYVSLTIPTDGDVILSEAFHNGILASEDPSLPFGKCTNRELRCLNWCFDRIAIDSGLSLDKVSTKYYGGTESDGEYGEALVSGGFYQIFHYLATEMPLDIHFNKTVCDISVINYSGYNSDVNINENNLDDFDSDSSHSDNDNDDNDNDSNFNSEDEFSLGATTIEKDDESTYKSSYFKHVKITCTDGSIYYADHVICTIPIGVLRTNRITFNPRPPQLDRMCKLQFGLMNLVWLWFPKKFWPDGYNFFGVTRRDNEPITFTTFLIPKIKDQYGNEQPILMCQIFDEFAEFIEHLTNDEIADLATIKLRQIFGNDNVPNPIGCLHSSWKSDTYAGGSYSCAPPVGYDSAHLIHDWSNDSGVEGIYFAGEGCHLNHLGTAHGAYISGIRESTKILEKIGCNNPWKESIYLDSDTDSDTNDDDDGVDENNNVKANGDFSNLS